MSAAATAAVPDAGTPLWQRPPSAYELALTGEREIRDRDGWRCTNFVVHRLSGRIGRCPVMGSEMLVVNERTVCPGCAGGERRYDVVRPWVTTSEVIHEHA